MPLERKTIEHVGRGLTLNRWTTPAHCVPLNRRERWDGALTGGCERGVTWGDDSAPTQLAQPTVPAILALSPELIHRTIHKRFHRVIHWQSSPYTGQ
jgi:hypothetical protein